MADRVTIFDTTLRDGEQAPGFSLRVPEKLQLARHLDRLGVDVIEAGFPIASDADAEAVRVVAAALDRPVVAALARCRPDDIERAGEALTPGKNRRIHTFIATSDLHLERKLHISREQCLDAAVAAVTQAGRYTDNIQFSAEDATRSDFDFLCRVVESVIKAGATTVNLPDTVGYSTPDEIFEFFSAILSRVPNADKAIFSAHCHDDLGSGRRQHAGRAPRRRAPGRVHDQRHRRARRERVARRDRDGDTGACRSPALRDRRRQRTDLPRQPAPDEADRRGRPGQQGHRRTQRLCARSRHSPGRHAEGSPDLRDHAPRRRRRPVDHLGARETFRPARGPASRAAVGDRALAPRAGSALSPHGGAGGSAEDRRPTPSSRKSSRTSDRRPPPRPPAVSDTGRGQAPKRSDTDTASDELRIVDCGLWIAKSSTPIRNQ